MALDKLANSSESSFCSSCGTVFKADAKFCAGCGQAVNGNATKLTSLVMALETLQAQVAELEVALPPTASELIQARFTLAVAYLRKEQTTAAIAQLQLIGQYNPNNAIAHAYLGAALLEEYQLEEAKAELETALELAPNNAIVRLKMGEFYLKLGMFPNAVTELEAAQQLPPPSPETAFYIHTLLQQTRKHNQKIIARPNNAVSLKNLGLARIVTFFKREPANLSSQSTAE